MPCVSHWGFSSSEGCDWKSAESDKAGLHTHTKTHQKNMLGMLTSTWHGIRFLYFTISFNCVSASSNESWGLTRLWFFTAEKAHNPLTKNIWAWTSYLSYFYLFNLCHFNLYDPSACAFTFSPPEGAEGNEQQAAPGPGHGGGTGERGCGSLPVSHLISRLLCSGLLCTGHMYSRQRRGEADGPLCREASITSLVTMQRNDQPASGTAQTLMCGLRNKKKFWTCSWHTDVIIPHEGYSPACICVVSQWHLVLES